MEDYSRRYINMSFRGRRTIIVGGSEKFEVKDLYKNVLYKIIYINLCMYEI